MTNQMNHLIAKANEPLVTPEKEKRIQKQVEAYKTVQSLTSNLTSGIGSFSAMALKRGQALGDKTLKNIEAGINKLCSLTDDMNDNLECMAGPG